MSFDALALCINAKNIRPTSKLVLLVLANYANEQWQSYPSKKKLSELCNCDSNTIKRSLDELVEKGYIKSEFRFQGNKQTSNLYTISRGIKLSTPKIEGGGVSKSTPNTITLNNQLNINKYTEQFEVFWKLYPEEDFKWNKKLTYKQWIKIKDKTLLLNCLKNYKMEVTKFYHNPVKWLRDEYYINYKIVKVKVSNKNTLAG